jgi:hypothetical protein
MDFSPYRQSIRGAMSRAIKTGVTQRVRAVPYELIIDGYFPEHSRWLHDFHITRRGRFIGFACWWGETVECGFANIDSYLADIAPVIDNAISYPL